MHEAVFQVGRGGARVLGGAEPDEAVGVLGVVGVGVSMSISGWDISECGGCP